MLETSIISWKTLTHQLTVRNSHKRADCLLIHLDSQKETTIPLEHIRGWPREWQGKPLFDKDLKAFANCTYLTVNTNEAGEVALHILPRGLGGMPRGRVGGAPPRETVDAEYYKKDQPKLSPADEKLIESLTEDPIEFCCSISMELMQDPVFASDGHTYDRTFIEKHFSNSSKPIKSPKTNQPLKHQDLTPNHDKRGQIIAFKERQADALFAQAQRFQERNLHGAALHLLNRAVLLNPEKMNIRALWIQIGVHLDFTNATTSVSTHYFDHANKFIADLQQKGKIAEAIAFAKTLPGLSYSALMPEDVLPHFRSAVPSHCLSNLFDTVYPLIEKVNRDEADWLAINFIRSEEYCAEYIIESFGNRRESNNVPLLEALGKAFQEEGEPHTAALIFVRLSRLTRPIPPAALKPGQDPNPPLTYARRAFEIDPQCLSSHPVLIGSIHLLLAEIEKDREPTSLIPLLSELVNVYTVAGQYAEAERFGYRMLEIDPKSAQALQAMRKLYELQGRPLQMLDYHLTRLFGLCTSSSQKQDMQTEVSHVVSLFTSQLSDLQRQIDDLRALTLTSTGRAFQGHQSAINRVIPLANGYLASCSEDGTIKVWDPRNQRCTATLTGHSSSVIDICELPKGLLASLSDDEELKVWDIQGGKCVATLHDKMKAPTISFRLLFMQILPNGYLLVEHPHKTTDIYDTSTNQRVASLPKGYRLSDQIAHTVDYLDSRYASESGTFSLPNGHIAFFGPSWIQVWTSDFSRTVAQITNTGDKQCALITLLPNGLISYTEKGDSGIQHIWNPETGQKVCSLDDNTAKERISSPLLLPNGTLATVSRENIKIWDPSNGKCLRSFKVHEPKEGMIGNLVLMPEGQLATFHSCNEGRKLKLWDSGAGSCLREIDLKDHLSEVQFNADGSVLLFSEKGIQWLNPTTGVTKITAKLSLGEGIGIFPNGDILATLEGDQDTSLVIRNGKVISRIDTSDWEMPQILQLKNGGVVTLIQDSTVFQLDCFDPQNALSSYAEHPPSRKCPQAHFTSDYRGRYNAGHGSQ